MCKGALGFALGRSSVGKVWRRSVPVDSADSIIEKVAERQEKRHGDDKVERGCNDESIDGTTERCVATELSTICTEGALYRPLARM